MRHDFALGARSYWAALKFIFKHRLFTYLIIPLLLAILLFIGVKEITLFFSEPIADTILGWFGYSPTPEADQLAWYERLWYSITGGAAWALRWGIRLLIYSVWTVFGKYLLIVILSPVLAMLSEKTEKIITDNEYPFQLHMLLTDIWRGIRIAARNMFIEYAIVIPCYLLAILLFPVSPLFRMIAWTVSSYFYGFSMMDYVNERRRLTVKESAQFVWKHKGLTAGIGMMYNVLSWIPIIGMMFAPVLSAVAAVLSIHELIDLRTNLHAHRSKENQVVEVAN